MEQWEPASSIVLLRLVGHRLIAIAVVLENTPYIHALIKVVPVLNSLELVTMITGDFIDETFTISVIGLAALWPLFKPQPCCILNAISLTHKRGFLATTLLVTIDYFDWSTRLPCTTLIATTVILTLLPAWFMSIRRRPLTSSWAIIVGDDRTTIEQLPDAPDIPNLGYVTPSGVLSTEEPTVVAYVMDGAPRPSLLTPSRIR